jgi:hypothetical protein
VRARLGRNREIEKQNVQPQREEMMSEVVALAHALSAIKAASDLVKNLRSVEGRVREADLKIKIADLAEALANARVSILEAQEEILVLQRRVRELESEPDFRSQLELRESVYYMRNPPAGRSEGPYCPACFEASELLIPVTRLSSTFRDLATFACPRCKATF